MNSDFVNKFIVIILTTEIPLLITFHASKIVHSNVTNVITKKYAFREHRFVTILMMFILTK